MARPSRALGLIVVASVAMATLSSAAPQWTYASSDHFEVYTTGGESRARQALASFERVHAFFTDYMGLSPATTRPTRLIVFSSEAEFKPYRATATARAFYQAGADRDYIVLSSLDPDSQRVVVHEYVHLIVRHANVSYPVWLNEGLAEFFSTIEPQGSKMAVGKVPVDRLLYLNTGGRLLPLTRLLAIEHGDPEYSATAHVGTFYSESWALVHMLMTDARYRPNTHTFMEGVGNGDDARTVLPSAFGKPIAAIQSDLEGYIRKQTYAYLSAPYTQPKINDKAPVRTADAFEAGLVTANLLAANPGKADDARAAFELLSRQKPEDVGLLESRADFELRARHDDVARPLLEQAIDLGSTNPVTYRDLATRFSLPLEDSESLLRKAVTLDPADVTLRLYLADAQVRLRKGADAVATLAPIKRVGPDDAFRLFELLANAHLLEGHLPEAVAASRQAMDRARTPEEKQYAERLVQSVAVDAARVTAVGRLKNVVCSAPLILEIAADGKTLRVAIDDPSAIRVIGTGQAPAELKCGPQDVPVRVAYEPVADRARNTVGNVRVLDFTVKLTAALQ
jgi:Flp pilus assembly protein TadD